MAGESKYAGNPMPNPRVRRGATRQSGTFTEKTWEGTQDAIYGQMGEIIDKADWESWDLDHDGNKYTLKVRWADSQDEGTAEDQIVNEVRLHSTEQHSDIRKLPAFSTVTHLQLTLIDALIDDPKNADNIVVHAVPAGSSPSIALSDLIDENGPALQLYQLYRRGIRNVPFSQQILERRRIAAATFNFSGTVSSAYENIDLVIAPGSIDGDAALGGILNFALPSGGQVIDDVGLIYNYGWLKKFPSYDYSAGSKAIVAQTWLWGLYAQAIYGVPI